MSTTWPDFNDLWDYGDPAGTELKFLERLPEARKSGDDTYRLQLMTQVARTYSLRKLFEQAHALLDQVHDAMPGGTVVEVRYLLERGRTYASSGETSQAIDCFNKAITLGEKLSEDFYTIDALHMLGIVAPAADRLDWNLKAIEAARASTDGYGIRWLGSLLNNTGWTYFDREEFDTALDIFQKTADHYEEQEEAEFLRIAQWSRAKTLRMLERYDEALAILTDLENPEGRGGFTEEELAESLYAIGRVDEARPYFVLAYNLLSGIDWVAEDKTRISRLKALSEAS